MSETQTLKVDFILQELKNVEWDTLGTYLGLSQSEIKEIESNFQITGRRRIVMLDTWLKKEESPSWEKIITALENMSETSLASKLRKKYQQQQHSDENAATTRSSKKEESPIDAATERVILKLDRKDQVAKEIESLKESFVRLVMSAESALETAGPTSRQLKRFSQSYISNRVVTSVEELFDCLGELSFLDYALLEHTISMFLKEAQPVVSDLSDYIQQLTDFKKSTTLNEFMDTIKKAQKPNKGSGMCTVTLHLVGGWLIKTMEDLERLLKEIFQDKSSVLAHLTIVRGSIIVSYLVPQSESGSLVKQAQSKNSFMTQVGVCKLIIGQRVVMKTQNDMADFSFEYSLVKAVKNNDINLLTFLLYINTSPNATHSKGWTALMYGCHYGQKKAVSILLEADASPNLQAENGAAPLLIAAESNHSDIVSLLLKVNADPNIQKYNGTTPLLMAAQYDYSDIVSILLQVNTNPNIHSDDGVTPLFVAAQNGHSDTVSILLQANANPNIQRNDGDTPLFMAAQKGHTDIVNILLQVNTNPNIQSDDGVTPLFVAAQNGHTDIVSGLLQHNADVHLQRYDGITPLLMAAENGHTDIVNILLQVNTNPNIQSNDGVAPLFMAAQNGHTDIVSSLLQHNADVHLQRYDGVTPLLMAAQNGHYDAVSILLQADANPNIQQNDGITPLYSAAKNGHTNIVSSLLRANSNPNHQLANGVTPLFVAAQNGHSETVRILLQQNADPNLQRDDGATPRSIALKYVHLETVRIISNPYCISLPCELYGYSQAHNDMDSYQSDHSDSCSRYSSSSEC